MISNIRFLYPAAAFVCWLAGLCPAGAAAGELKNATVLIIRHAEKPAAGDGLTPAGEARAKAYVDYFQNFKFHAEPVKLDAIIATADSKNSRRPRLTVEPLAHAMNLRVNESLGSKEIAALVNELKAQGSGKTTLICWHHGEFPALLTALGADPSSLLPGGQWPGEEYGWVLVLRYDAEGKLQTAERVVEGL